jgi:hypothetical protein
VLTYKISYIENGDSLKYLYTRHMRYTEKFAVVCISYQLKAAIYVANFRNSHFAAYSMFCSRSHSWYNVTNCKTVISAENG